MDKLPADQQAAIAKWCSDRLRQTLLSAREEAAVSTMGRLEAKSLDSYDEMARFLLGES